jgi:hypothetical protein
MDAGLNLADPDAAGIIGGINPLAPLLPREELKMTTSPVSLLRNPATEFFPLIDSAPKPENLLKTKDRRRQFSPPKPENLLKTKVRQERFSPPKAENTLKTSQLTKPLNCERE